MDISFANKRLQRQLMDAGAMAQAYGPLAGKLKLRLDLLKNVRCLAEVPHTPPHRRHLLTGDWAGHFAVDVSKSWRLIFKPNHDPVPTKADGGIDLQKVTAVEIVD